MPKTHDLLPEGFTYITDPRILLSIDYATSHNFIGRPIAGYEKIVGILSEAAATALIRVQDALDVVMPGHHLKIFDGYRPTRAVADFVQWSKDPYSQAGKSDYYPLFDKPELFQQGYIGSQSTHSRGSTVDLTITRQSKDNSNEFIELDMGTRFDFFDETANTDSPNVSSKAKENRGLLKRLMEEQGFENFPMEWWHFTLKDEPYPDTYFDFVVR